MFLDVEIVIRQVPPLAGGQKEKDGGVERTVREGSCSLKPGRDEDDLFESMKNVYRFNKYDHLHFKTQHKCILKARLLRTQ